MAATNSTTDGLGFEEVNQSVTSTDVISGTSIYASSLLRGKYITSAGSIDVSGHIYTPEDVYGKMRRLSTVGVGSPASAWGNVIQVGSNVTGAGSLVWTAFPTTFSSIPLVQVTPIGAPVVVGAGSISIGSFVTYSIGAAIPFTWMAAGSLV